MTPNKACPVVWRPLRATWIFWHPLSDPASAQWHPVFAGALGFIRRHLAPPG